MKKFVLITPTQRVTFNLPMELFDISAKYLSNVTDHVRIADYHTLIGLVYHDKLGNIILARKQAKKTFTAGVIPIFIRSGKSDEDFLQGIKVKDKLIIPPADLAMGYHVTCPNNSLSLDVFINYLDKDPNVARRYNNNYGYGECYFVEFKIVPNCNIKGFYRTNPVLRNDQYINIVNLETSHDDESDYSSSVDFSSSSSDGSY